MAAPPKSAPTATAAVGMAAALVTLELAEAAEVLAELAADLMEEVKLWSSELIEERAGPVAVESSADRLERALPASLVIELTWDDSAELIDESTELMELESAPLEEDDEVDEAEPVDEVAEGLTVVVLCCAETTAARAAKRMAERILMVCGWFGDVRYGVSNEREGGRT